VALVTHGGALVQGLPASDGVADLYLKDADRRIHVEAERLGVSVTRYSDNFLMSGANRDVVMQMARFVKAELQKLGLRVRCADPLPRFERQEVLGLTVNNGVSVSKRRRKKVRDEIRRFRHRELKLRGNVGYVGQLHPRAAERLKAMLHQGATPREPSTSRKCMREKNSQPALQLDENMTTTKGTRSFEIIESVGETNVDGR
jgi:hypothetical protein